MAIEIILAYSGAAFYALASILGVISLVRPSRSYDRPVACLMAIGVIPLVTVLVMHAFQTSCVPAFGRFQALTWYSLAISAAYLYMATKHQMRGISGILAPYITIILILAAPAAADRFESVPNINQAWLSLHILSAFIGYGLFTLASTMAVAYLIQDFNLKHKRFGVAFERLPALETIDHLMCRQIQAAFLVFTVSIASAIPLIHLAGSQEKWITDPKTMATVMTWLVYATLLHLRVYAKHQGRKIALATLVGLLCVLFTFFGIHAVSESIHDFVSPNKTENSK